MLSNGSACTAYSEEFDAGPIALEAAVIANSKALLAKEVKRSPLRKGTWGSCAIVGNAVGPVQVHKLNSV